MPPVSDDPEINAAFGGASIAPAAAAPIDDDEINAAFADVPKKDTTDKRRSLGAFQPPRGLEDFMHGVTSGVGQLGGGLTYLGTLAATGDPKAAEAVRQETADKLTYQPRMPANAPEKVTPWDNQYYMPKTDIHDIAKGVGGGLQRGATALGASPEAAGVAGAVGEAGIEALPYAAVARFGAEAAPARGAVAEESAAGAHSMGAAEAPIQFTSPDLQAKYQSLKPAQIEANRAALTRHAEADSLPVPMRLTEGEATQNPDIISDEMNNRGATGLSKTYQERGAQFKANLQAIREETGPDVFSTTPAEHGDTLINAYKAKDEPIVADINSKYEALHQAAQAVGVDAPIDGQAFANSARVALRKKLLSNDVPSSVQKDIEGFANGEPMNFEDFESMRSKLAQEMRDNPSGNQRSAAGLVRQALEDLPLKPEAAALKPLADQARAAARARFAAQEADPAYKAAVNDDIAPEKFVRKFITSDAATRDSVATMRANLADNPTATQTLGVAAMDDLRSAAGLTSQGEGKFAQSRFNKRVDSQSDKLKSLLPPPALENVRNLGKVARYIQEAPEGETVNRSGTLSGAIAQFVGKGAKSYANVKSGGFAGPVLDVAGQKMAERAMRKKLEKATAPLAGID